MARLPNEEEKIVIRLYKEALANKIGVKRRKTIVTINQLNELLPGFGLSNDKETQTEVHKQK
jgi:hypothetical protein